MKENEQLHVENNLIFDTTITQKEQTSQFKIENSMLNICGIWIPCKKKMNSSTGISRLVYTNTTMDNLKALAMAISQAGTNGILLEGVTGCGKTTLVEELANLTGNTGLFYKENKE